MSRALILPGQGVATFPFLKKLIRLDPSFKSYLDTLDETIGEDFSGNLLTDQSELPDQNFFLKTSNQQPAILASSYIAHQFLLKHKNINVVENADYIIGHSLGEFTSLLFNGVISYQDAIKLVRQRGLIMEENIKNFYETNNMALPSDFFKMTAFLIQPKSFNDVVKYLTENEKYRQVYLSNINSHKQVVVVGLQSLINETVNEMKEKLGLKIKTKNLPVTIPFHSPILAQSEKDLADYVEKSTHNGDLTILSEKLKVPFVSNYNLQKTDNTKEALQWIIKNTTKKVDFVGLVDLLYSKYNVRGFAGIGPGNIAKLAQVALETGNWDNVKIENYSLDDID